MNQETLLSDFAPFVDIGESAPKISDQKGKFIVRFKRDGKDLKITVDPGSGVAQFAVGRGAGRNHPSIGHLLASESFANLRRWADIQRESLQGVVDGRILPVNAKTHDGHVVTEIQDVSHLLGSAVRANDAAEVLLIDGPAGIGKTSLIARLAFERATAYKVNPTPLILHIKSRGRVLSNIDDLMAFSLQTIRSTVTYDQVPVLVRHGLIVAAIDGFDELGDPNGYETAWAQLSELISFVRGRGTLILAGRDTFISRSRLLKDVNSLREEVDIVNSLTLLPPSPEQAKEWLRSYGWTEENFRIPAVAGLFDDDSFARRPVFLKLLAEQIKPKNIKTEKEGFLTPFLLRSIIEREAGLFGKAVQAVFPLPRIEVFLNDFMLEVAREMADMQSEALDGATLSWVAEASIGDGVPADILGLLKNRAAVVALLVNDERPSYKTFVHSQIQNYFLAKVAIEAIARGDVPKFIRRNILGAEFVSIFVDVVVDYFAESSQVVSEFIAKAQSIAQTYPHLDRGSRNIGALLLASLQNVQAGDKAYLAGFQVDDAILRGTAGPAVLNEIVVNQMDCRQADLRALTFEDSSVICLIADDASRFPISFPLPRILVKEGGDELTDAGQIEEWLATHGRFGAVPASSVVSQQVKDHRVYALLGRVCRMRRYWLRKDCNDVQAEKILGDPNWQILSQVLLDNEFLRIDKRDAAGGAAPFYHIRHAARLLTESSTDLEVVKFFQDLDSAIN